MAGVTGPMTIAGHMVSVERLILGTMLMPEWVKSVVKSIVPICKAYSQTLSDVGADVIQMSEGLASPDMILPDNFMEFSGDFLKDCLVSVKGAFSSLHICGDTTHILEKMASLGVDALSIEEKVNPAYAVNVVKRRAALVGNIGVVSPLMQGTPKDCVVAAEKTMSAGFDIIASGCGLSYGVSNENLEAVTSAVKGRR